MKISSVRSQLRLTGVPFAGIKVGRNASSLHRSPGATPEVRNGTLIMAHFFGSTLLKVLRSCHKLSVCPLSFSSKGSILNVDGSFCANGGYARFLSRPASEHRVITMGNGIPV